MYDIKWIRDNAAQFDAGLASRGAEPLSSTLIALDERRRAAIARAQAAQERRNALSKEIGKAMAAKDMPRADELKSEVAVLKDVLTEAEAEEKAAVGELDTALAAIPNTPLAEVPLGSDEHGNVQKTVWGTPKQFAFTPKQHFEIGEGLGLMDFETAAKMSGTRFVITRAQMARLERALGQFMLDLHTTEHGYTEINPPLLVKDQTMFGTAQLPKFADDQFRVLPDYWLIPTAEVPMTNIVREAIVDEKELPLRFTALTPCFRAEAGAAGRDTRGMIRQHQFWKVELVSVTSQEQSLAEHERMTACAEKVLQKLGLPYRVMTLCTGDMGFGSQKTYDLEVWLPGQNAYREISSCSVCGDFQARRMNARYKGADGKNKFVHTLNGSGVAVGRALVAVLENYQNEDGSVTVPDVLRPYMGGLTKIEKAQ
ncbi:serine--tRNA ligase [Rhizobiales bacterium TNE-4]|nr:serine--tRNA ligase [Rhizobiales bacterium TNE-4]MBV1826791.1 serine--tRNA ligase [Rhizobiales bacterium TNE-4]